MGCRIGVDGESQWFTGITDRELYNNVKIFNE